MRGGPRQPRRTLGATQCALDVRADRPRVMAERVSTVFHVPMCSRYFPHVTPKILYINLLSFFAGLTGSRVFQYIP